MSQLRVFLLGTPHVEYEGKSLKIPHHKALALLAYLSLHAGEHNREYLATLLWPDADPQRAYACLRDALWRLKETPVEEYLDADRLTIGLRKDKTPWVDVLHIRRCLAACRAHGHPENEVCADCIPLLTDVAETWSGNFMEGFTLKDSVEFDDWQSAQAATLQEQLSGGLERLVRWYHERGSYRQAIAYALRRVTLDPLHETAQQQLMRLYALDRQGSLAIRQYQDFQRLLERELGISPAEETTHLAQQIRDRQLESREAPSPPPAMPAPADDHPAPSPSGAGERRIVTVLVARIGGAAALSERRAVGEEMETLERIRQALGDEVQRYGGALSRYRQDGLMALFGAPTAQENDPECAVLAALAMQDALRRTADLPATLTLQVGVCTGEVVTLAGDREPRPHEEPVLGLPIMLATQLADMPAPGAVLVAESTYRQVASLFTWQSLSPAPGLEAQEAVALFRPLAHRRLPDKGRGIEGLHSPLVGRDAQFRDLQKAVERVCAGLGGIVTVVGEAGIGKSRLVGEIRAEVESRKSEVTEAPDDRGAATGDFSPVWIEGRCLSYAVNVPYQVWLDMLRSWLKIAPDADPSAIRATLRIQVGEICPNQVDDVYPFLARLLLLPLGASITMRLQGMNAEDMQKRTFRAIATLIESAARQQPLILICEDLHWADPTSLAALESLLPLTDRVPFLLICVMRPATEHGCWRIKELAARAYRHRHTDLSLEALSYDQSAALINNLLPTEILPAHLRDRILAHADGNPFFLEEILRSLIANGVVVYDDAAGRWRTTREIDALAIPDTVNGVLTARIDRLAPATKHVLQLAAVIGHTFSRRVLENVTQTLGITDLEQHLITLQHTHLIHERTALPEREYIFEHVLTQEAAYNGLLKHERRAIHRRVTETLERLYPKRIEEQMSMLAYHWDHAGDTRHAAPYPRRAGELTLYARILVMEARAELARIILTLGNARLALAYVEQILDFLRENPALSLPGYPAFSAAREPMLVYLTCYRVLRAAADPRAPKILHVAYTMIQERAAKIENADLRQAYLEDVPYHREIIAEWERRSAESPNP